MRERKGIGMKILIIDDHPLVRKGIISVLQINKVGNYIGEADNIAGAIDEIKSRDIDIALVDLHLGKEDGFDLIKQAQKLKKKTKFIVLTSSSSVFDFKKAQDMGVDGYILKEAFVEDVIYALKVVSRGEKFFSAQMVQQAIVGIEPQEIQVLTQREKEVFMQLKEGYTNTEISSKLFISEGTTKKHISNILSKLNLANRVDVYIYANKIYSA